MATLNMQGPYKLTAKEIENQVAANTIGNYALGFSKDGTFYVKYIGRSDDDLNGRLKDWVGNYDEFKFSTASSAEAAYKKELKNFNDFGGVDKLDNKITPDKP